MPTATRGDHSIHYQELGEGPTVLLVPGLGSGSKLFGTLPRRFARSGFRALTFDPVGIAPSSPHQGDYDLVEAGHDALAVLAAARAGSAHLVGTSLGGKVALSAAHLDPGRVLSLTMLASSAVPTARGELITNYYETVAGHLNSQQVAAAVIPFLFGRTFHERYPQVVRDIMRSTRPDAARRQLMVAQARALGSWDGRSLATEVLCPALCVAGAQDTLTGTDEVRTTARLLPNGRFLLIEEAGHLLLLESAAVYDAVESFLVEISGAGP